MSNDIYQDLMELAKKRGFFWGSYEIYGGLSGFYDMGPLGVLVKRELVNAWLRRFVYSNDLAVEIETPIINPRIVFVASGHEESFLDPVLVCESCGRVYRADHLIKEKLGLDVEGWSLDQLEQVVRTNNLNCPECGGKLGKPFNVMLLFRTEIGPYRGEAGYLKPEHAQGMFINFANVLRIRRNKLPFGVAQVGRVARNEISPRQGLLRLREFTIMELEFFFDPELAEEESREYIQEVINDKLRVITADMKLNHVDEPQVFTVRDLLEKKIVKTPWMAYWMAIGNRFLKELGILDEHIRFVEKLPHERAHYSAQTFDQEVYTEKYGWVEVAGYAYRTDYDLKRHISYSKADLYYFKKYDEPVEKEVKKAIPDYAKIRSSLGDASQEIIKALGGVSQEELFAQLESKGFVEVAGVRLGPEYFIVKTEKTKVTGERIIPHVVEPSFGVERVLYVLLEHAYTTKENRVVLKLPKKLAPYHVAVFPLVAGKKPEHARIVSLSRKIYRELIKRGYRVIYDDDGSIGRRYARVDEIGVPLAITVDYQSVEDGSVTVRYRDTWEQVRIGEKDLYDYIRKFFEDETY